MQKNENRAEWVDVLRGIAVFLVVLGHIFVRYPFHLIVNPIKMPIIYFIAGYVASFSKPLKQIAMNRFKQLFIPLLVFSLFPLRILYYLFITKSTASLLNYLYQFSVGKINWFIYSFFISSVLFAAAFKLVKGNKAAFGGICLAFFIVGILTKDIPVMDIWCINTALTGMLFMYCGFLMKNHQVYAFDSKIIVSLNAIVYIVLIWVSYQFYNGMELNFHTCEYYNIVICLCLFFTGVVVCRFAAIQFCSKCQGCLKRFLVQFGQNTIVVYLIAPYYSAAVYYGINILLHQQNPGFFLSFIVATVSCILGYYTSLLCKRYFPFLLGIKK